MKPRSVSASTLFLIPLVLATTAALGDALPGSQFEPADGQAKAAALLSRPPLIGAAPGDRPVTSPSTAPASTDAQAQAAALLSRPRTGPTVLEVAPAKRVAAVSSADGHQRAAALLSRQQTS